MEVVLAGALIRAMQGLLSAVPTLVVGLFIAAVLRYYLRVEGILKLFGGSGFRSLAQSWLIGMLLPVCSVGVIPIIRELKRMGLRPGAISAFALSAPLFNPLSLLYGLTLSRPYVIIGFALASLLVVTVLGIVWDRWTRWTASPIVQEPTPVSLRRLAFCGLYMARELIGPSGALALVALAGLLLLGAILPHGALQSSVEQDNNWAPLLMAVVAVPVYATPMLTMSQLGMMFVHGNSPGAAFSLLLLGTGVNLATVYWMARNYSWRSTGIWFAILVLVVVGCAYAVNKPLIPPGIEPAGHTHAFDIYTNPLTSGDTISFQKFGAKIMEGIPPIQLILSLVLLLTISLVGLTSRLVFGRATRNFLSNVPELSSIHWEGLHRKVSAHVLGLTLLAGLIAFSVVGCYAYYPAPEETLEEMRLVRVNILSGVSSGDYQEVLHYIPDLEHWSRMLEVGYFIRNLELRPYQRMQAHLLRKKLELLEHACEDMLEAESGKSLTKATSFDPATVREELDALRNEISQNARRLMVAFQSPKG